MDPAQRKVLKSRALQKMTVDTELLDILQRMGVMRVSNVESIDSEVSIVMLLSITPQRLIGISTQTRNYYIITFAYQRHFVNCKINEYCIHTHIFTLYLVYFTDIIIMILLVSDIKK